MKLTLRNCFLAALLVALPLCLSAKLDQHPLCHTIGNYDEDVCEISMIRLLANPGEFDGRIVQITGFFADGSAPLLFMDEEAYSSSRTVDSVFLKIELGRYADVLLRQNRSFVIVIGRYSAKDKVIPEGASGERIGGSIAVSEASRAVGPWGYSDPPSSLMKRQRGDGSPR